MVEYLNSPKLTTEASNEIRINVIETANKEGFNFDDDPSIPSWLIRGLEWLQAGNQLTSELMILFDKHESFTPPNIPHKITGSSRTILLSICSLSWRL